MNYRDLLFYGVYSDLRTEIARRFLGFLWWIIEPVMYMAVFYIVFGLALRQGGPDYVPFLLCGMIAWKWFDGSVRQASISITGNSGLIQQIFVPKSLLALIQILGNTFKFLIVLLLLLTFLLLIGKRPSWHWLSLLPIMLTQLFLIVSLGLLLAAIIPFAQDFKQVVDNLMMLLMFMSGIFFSADSVPMSMRPLFELNPMVLLIESYRAVLLDNQWPGWSGLGYVWMVGTPMLLAALFTIRRNERRYPKMMI
ncbi:ABC transporter permease [Pseudomonas indica]|jgi:lipopolysaccharide transport system permease protein|uniref:ABC transporter permease n=1 Tax=Pseudomonas indica TaxID=137658 RepID=UPI000BAC13A1|nr:ABC transporter permease [Pseudomonas indica]PAU56401.1 teichoic acid ABC transporter permease [Pseudomonas indica]